MAVITKTLKSTGGDYSSMVTWEAGEQTDLVTDGDSHVLECYAGTTTTGNWQADGSLDENNIIVDGWITGASNIITIKAASGSEHGGVLESGFFIKTSASSFTRVLYINDPYVNLEDIQIVQTNTSHQTRTLEIGQANCIVSRCISKTNTTNSSGRAVTANSGSIIRNSLFVSASTGSTVSVQSFNSPTYQNCTVINTSSGDGLNGVASGTGPVVTNTVCYSASGSAFSGTIDGSSDYNAGNGTTAPGANSVDNIDTSDFNNYASGDYSPSATSNLINAGTDLSGTFTDDIAGNTRGATFDIGAYEFVSAAATVSPNDLSQSQTLDNVTLTQAHSLTPNALDQSQTLDNVTLTQANVLSVQDAAQSQTLDNVTLTQAQIISVADLSQSQSLDNITLTQAHVLTLADVSQAQTLDNVTLTQANILSVADLSQDQTLDNVTLTIAGILAINDLTTGQTLDNVALTQAGILSVNELSQGQTLDAVTLTQAYILAINDLTQNQTLDNVTLNVGAYTITPDNISHLQTLDGVTLTQYHVLLVDDLRQSQILDAVTLGGLVIGSLNGTLVVYALLDGELTVTPLLDGTVKTLH